MKRKIYAIIGLMIAVVMVFTACTAGKDNEAANGTDQETISVVSNEESSSELTTVETTTETTTEATTAATTQSTTKAQTATKAQTTAKKAVADTTKSTPKKQPTTKPVTTTQPKTTVANVTAKEVQQQVNNYIKSKGAKLNAIDAYGVSMTPDSASWSTRIDRSQTRLNNGKVLKDCKEWVNLELEHGAKYLYCYYDSNWFYILWLD